MPIPKVVPRAEAESALGSGATVGRPGVEEGLLGESTDISISPSSSRTITSAFSLPFPLEATSARERKRLTGAR